MIERAVQTCLLITLLMLALAGLTLRAQDHKQPLANDDVIKLVKAGLSEETIVVAIEQGQSNFDTSPASLIDLKNQGVSPRIIEAMLLSGSESHSHAHIGIGDKPGMPPASVAGADILADGTYYKSPTGWIKLQQLMMAGGGATHVGKLFIPGLTPQIVWTYRGAEAPVQISERRPTFLIKQSPYMANTVGHTDRDIVIVRFNKKKDHRELQTTSGGNVFTFKAGFSKEKVVDINVTRISDTTFSVAPVQDLSPGEYLLDFAAFGSNGFDFGIRSEDVVVDAPSAGEQLSAPLTRSTISALGITAEAEPTRGVVIIGMEPGGVAEKLGLHVGYIITSVDGKSVTGPAELETELQNRVPGTKIRLGYMFRSSALNSRMYYSNETTLLAPPR